MGNRPQAQVLWGRCSKVFHAEVLTRRVEGARGSKNEVPMGKRIKGGEAETCQGALALEKEVVFLVVALEGQQAICVDLMCILWMTSTMACLTTSPGPYAGCALVCTGVH